MPQPASEAIRSATTAASTPADGRFEKINGPYVVVPKLPAYSAADDFGDGPLGSTRETSSQPRHGYPISLAARVSSAVLPTSARIRFPMRPKDERKHLPRQRDLEPMAGLEPAT